MWQMPSYDKAVGAKTGEVLGRFNNGSGHNGGIVSYEADGKQYIGVVVGHGSYVGRALVESYYKEKFVNMKESAAIVAFSLP